MYQRPPLKKGSIGTPPSNITEFRDNLKIDKFALDDELMEQSMLLFQVSEAFVEAAALRDTCKEKAALVDAQLDSKIRTDAENSETRITEGDVKAQVQSDPKHEKAVKAYLAAKREADVLSALKEAFQQRGYMLRDLCSLHVANYYEQNSVRGTAATDTVAYNKRREILAEARARK